MTTEERFEKLERKLARAERQSRVMLVAVAMTVAGLFLLCAGNGVQKSVRAQGFELVDQNGNTRAGLSFDPTTGQPSLDLADQNDSIRASLFLSEYGQPMLRLADQVGKPRVELSLLGESGQPLLDLLDQNGMPRVGLHLDEYGQPMLRLADQIGKAIWHAP
jgi:hypothetical protein